MDKPFHTTNAICRVLF